MRGNPDYQRHEIGDWTYGTPQIYRWNDDTKLRIGKFCSIAAEVMIILGGEHRLDWVTTYPFNVVFERASQFTGHPAAKGDINIGNDVWIGTRSTILSGVKIGDGAVIAAGSLVTRSVDPYSIVGGNPARHIRFRFDSKTIEALGEIAWWNWNIDKIEENWNLLLAPDISEFIERHLSSAGKP
ncbi:MAG: CatB-related O-acetyltransferase [Pyrinomonadaceae bacterium]